MMLVADDHTGRRVWEENGRFWTAVSPLEDPREVETFTVRRLLNGKVSIVVAFAETSRPALRVVG